MIAPHHHLHNRRVLVTGATGFIGRHLCAALQQSGAVVLATSRSPIEGSLIGVGLISGDITDAGFVAQLVAKNQPEYVFHLAAFKKRSHGMADFRLAADTNFLATANLAMACQASPSFRQLVALGTCEEYGPAGTPFREESREMPANSYAVTKLAATYFLQTMHRASRFPVVILRPTLAYGPGQGVDMMLPALIRSLLAGRRFPMTPAAQTRDYVYIDDLVQAMLLASGNPSVCGQVMNVSSGEPVALRTIAEQVAALVGGEVADLLDFGVFDYRPGEAMSYWADPAAIQSKLGWRLLTGLQEGLLRTVDFYRAQPVVVDVNAS